MSKQIKNLRRAVYGLLKFQHKGRVPCFVCKKHVKEEEATLEHIQAKCEGGTNDLDNLSISHSLCNGKRNHKPVRTWIKRWSSFSDLTKD